MSLFFIHIIQINPWKTETTKFVWVTPFFHKKRGLKPQKIETLLGTTKANVEGLCFSIYITQITPLENGNHEFCMGHPLFPQKSGLKTQYFQVSLGTTKASV